LKTTYTKLLAQGTIATVVYTVLYHEYSVVMAIHVRYQNILFLDQKSVWKGIKYCWWCRVNSSGSKASQPQDGAKSTNR